MRSGRSSFGRWLVGLAWGVGLCAGASVSSRADVVISEFMASNVSTLTNSLGETADWIELYNTSPTPTNLVGWYLTDNAGNLKKWQFPPVTLDGYGYRLVYASGASESLIGLELHTNFKLDGKGEYLALVKPDGVSIVSAFAPAYPEQTADVSFGLRPDTVATPLVTTNSICRFKVPVDAADDAVWAAPEFNDGDWSTGLFGIGYESAPGDFAESIRTQVPNGTSCVYVRCEFEVENPALTDFLFLRVKYDDGFAAYLNGTRVAGANDPVSAQWDSLATAEQTNTAAVVFEEFDLSDDRSLLVTGTNVLAIRLLNANADPLVPTDLMLAAELRGEAYTPSPSAEWRYFHQPTPGARNVMGEADFVRPVAFSVEHGFFEAPFSLTLTAPTPGSEVYYTTNSSVPTPFNGIRYSAPFTISGTAVVRARAFKSNEEPSRVGTQTYLFLSDVIQQPVMDPRITQDAVYGPLMIGALRAQPAISIVVTNGVQIFAEHAASIELLTPDGSEPGFQIEAGVKYVGGLSLFYAKKSIRLYFRGQYGAGKLRYPIFARHPYGDSGVSEYDQLTLRNSEDSAFGGDDHRAQYVRPIWIDDMQLEMGDTGLRGRFVHVYINGVYWGIYHLRERPTEAYMAAYEGGVEADYSCRSDTTPSATWDTIRNAALSNKFTEAKSYLNERQFIDYMLLNYYAGNLDWYSNRNWMACGPIQPYRDGWKFFAWDSDTVLQAVTGNSLTSLVPGGVFDAMLRDADFRIRVADGIYRHYFHEGLLTPARVRPIYDARANDISTAIVAETARWQPGTLWTRDNWQTELSRLDTNFFVLRTDIVIEQFRDAGLYPLDAPEFSASGGVFAAAFNLEMTAVAPIYYTLDGTDPRAWGTGAIAGSLYDSPLPITNSTLVKARARSGATWSALHEELFVAAEQSPLRVTELMFHPRSPDAAETNAAAGSGENWSASDFEFIELRNPGEKAIGLAGVHFADGVTFDFTHGTVTTLGADEYVLVVKNRAAFAARYPGVPASVIAGEFEPVMNWPVKTLSDAGEQVRLVDGMGSNILSFTYGDGRGWPPFADGAGHSLVPIAMNAQSTALDYGGNWRASAFRDGSPGSSDPEPLRDVLLNEIGAHTDYTDPERPEYDSNDWLELFNASGAPVTLGDWYLSDRADNLKLWPIPATNVITAGGWLLFDEVHDFHSPITNGFGLSKAGEEVFLSYLPGNGQDRVADAVRFKGQENGVSLGRYADGQPDWYALAPTPNAANVRPTGHVIIAEVMYHPPDTNGANDVTREFIELYNPQGATADLWTADGTWRIEGGVSYCFPPNTRLAPYERLALVAFDPDSNAVQRTEFLATYGLADGQIRLLGPYAGGLDNRGGRVALEKPLKPDVAVDPLIWVIVDEVIYFDSSPWPSGTDGTGRSLERSDSVIAGCDPWNWFMSSSTTPGLPDARIELVQPSNGATFFAPAQVPLRAFVNAGQALPNALREVAFFDGTNRLGSVSTEPYVGSTSFEVEGACRLRAEFSDGAGVWVSPEAAIRVLSMANLPADDITESGATARGEVRGGAAEASVYWGLNDGGTNALAWEHKTTSGPVSNATFFVPLGPLEAGRAYYYRVGGSAGGQEGWAQTAASFVTTSYTNWERRLEIKATYTNRETLQDFPLLVTLGTNVSGFTYESFGGTWYSLRFTDEQGRRLPYEVQNWDTNGLSCVWVRMLELTNKAVLSAWWGRTSVTGAPSWALDGSVWAPGYDGVWHLEPGLSESSGLGAAAMDHDSMGAAGVVLQGRQFDGAGAYVDPGVAGSWYELNREHLTVSFWVRPEEPADGATPFGAETLNYDSGGSPSNRSLYMAVDNASQPANWAVTLHDTTAALDTCMTGQWQLVSLILSNGMAYGSVNDNPRLALGSYSSLVLPVAPLLGRRNGGASPFRGVIDEFRLARLARSVAWTQAEYLTVMQPDSFIRYGAVEPAGGIHPDADGNGLPDAWERAFFGENGGLRAAPGADWDGDGSSNAGEYTAGTDPTNSASVFAITLTNVNGQTLMQFEGLSAHGVGYEGLFRFYDLLSLSNLLSAPWLVVPGYSNLLGSNTWIVCTNPPSAGADPTFFRGRVRLEHP